MESKAYSVEEVRQMLQLSRSSVYKLVNDPPFHVLKLGKTIRIPKGGFDLWLMGQ